MTVSRRRVVETIDKLANLAELLAAQGWQPDAVVCAFAPADKTKEVVAITQSDLLGVAKLRADLAAETAPAA